MVLKLGNQTNAKEANAKGIIVIQNNAAMFAENLRDLVLNYQVRGFSLSATATELNISSIPTPRGAKWYPMSVRNLINRLNEIK
jgi:dihydroorotate dehydrogenase